MLGLCRFCLGFFEKLVKSTSTDTFVCPKLFLSFLKHRKSLEDRKILQHSQIQKNEGKNDKAPTFFYVKISRWTQL
jgi:hypothetical protein